MVTFEGWAIKPFPQANREPESAVNLAQLNWQGSDQNWILIARLFFSLLIHVRFSYKFKKHITVLFLNYQTFALLNFDEARFLS